MRLSKIAFLKFLAAALFLIFIAAIVPSIMEVGGIPDNLLLTSQDLNEISIRHIGYEISGDLQASAGSYNENTNSKLTFKLFNKIPIKTVNVRIEQERKAFLGGYPVGLSLKANGVIVVSKVEIETYAGKVYPDSQVEAGDIITRINGKSILYIDDIIEAMSAFELKDRIAEICVIRNGVEKFIVSNPVVEELTGYFKLGLEVKNNAEGIGTITYVKPDGRFGSLGHPIGGYENNAVIPCYNGDVYDCKLIGLNKGSRGTAGELKGVFANSSNPLGIITNNTRFGVFGNMTKNYNTELIDIGSRFCVKMGKAQIYTTIEDVPKYYNIEIIKVITQKGAAEKSMIIRVVDKELLSLTGGILQGMSGSPIIQNGKVIGAVTHVMVSDPTKGYGIYLDWMYNN